MKRRMKMIIALAKTIKIMRNSFLTTCRIKTKVKKMMRMSLISIIPNNWLRKDLKEFKLKEKTRST